MKSTLNKFFWIDVGLLALQFVNVWLAWKWWHEGDEVLFAMSGTAFIMGLWTCRRLFNFFITMFCMWWLGRKAQKMVAKIELRIAELKKEGFKNESNEDR